MPKLSEINIDTSRFRGKGIRPWNDKNVVKEPENKDDSVSNALAKREQSVSNALAEPLAEPLAKREQKSRIKDEGVSNALAEPLAAVLANREQSVSKALAKDEKVNNPNSVEILVGNERILLNFLFQKCKVIGSLETPTITTDELRNLLKIKAEHIRNLIYRLSNKGVIEISKLKNGRAGWRKFLFSKEVFQHLSLNQSVSNALANREQTVSKALAKPLAEPLASLSSSSGNNIIINKTTTTGEGENSINPTATLTGEWLEIDIEPLNSIGFTQTHLIQIASQNKLQPKIVQDSIYAFAFDLEKNGRAKTIKGDHINFFMGILRNGKPYAPSSNYESPQDKAMRIYLEKMRQIEQKRVAEEKEAFDLAFKDWFSKLSVEQKRAFLPEMLRRNANVETSKMLENNAKSHFEKEIWALNKVKIILED